MKYRKRPVVIEAVQYPCEHPALKRCNCDPNWPDSDGPSPPLSCSECGHEFIETLEGRMRVSPGDWIIEGVNGEFYPCKPDIFEKTYEEAGIGFQREEEGYCPVYSISDRKLAPASKVILRSPVGDVIYRLDEDKRQFPAT